MLVAVAGLGVLNTVVLDTRERVHDLGVFKALGMSPRQTIAMVLTSVGGIGLVAGPARRAGRHRGCTTGSCRPWAGPPAPGSRRSTSTCTTCGSWCRWPLGGLVIALAGALLPAGWAARTSTTSALRTE